MSIFSTKTFRIRISEDGGTTFKTVLDETNAARQNSTNETSVTSKDAVHSRQQVTAITYNCSALMNDDAPGNAASWGYPDVNRWATNDTPLQVQAGDPATGKWYDSFEATSGYPSWTSEGEGASVPFDFTLSVQGALTVVVNP